MLRVPDVVGVRLVGRRATRWRPILRSMVTERLRQFRLAGRFVEFFGPGVSTLSAGARAWSPTWHPSSVRRAAFFPSIEPTIQYLATLDAPHPRGLWNLCDPSASLVDPVADPRTRGGRDRMDRIEESGRSTTSAGPIVRPDRGDAAVGPGCYARAGATRWRRAGWGHRTRGDHQLHEYFRSAADYGGRPAGRRLATWSEAASLGEDVVRPWIPSRSAICKEQGFWMISRPWGLASSVTAARPVLAIPVPLTAMAMPSPNAESCRSPCCPGIATSLAESIR